jgi:hypothetical protein
LGFLVGNAPSFSVDDGAECASRGDEERLEGKSKTTNGRVAPGAEVNTSEAEGRAKDTSNDTALEDLGVVGFLLFLGENLHDDGLLCRWLEVETKSGMKKGVELVEWMLWQGILACNDELSRKTRVEGKTF